MGIYSNTGPLGEVLKNDDLLFWNSTVISLCLIVGLLFSAEVQIMSIGSKWLQARCTLMLQAPATNHEFIAYLSTKSESGQR